MSNLPEFVRSRLALRQTPLDEHPDANLLLAFSERTLSGPAKATLLTHLERCTDCREIVALSSADCDAPLPELGEHGTGRHLWYWPAAAALAGLIVAAVLTPHFLETAPPSRQPRLPEPIAAPRQTPPALAAAAKGSVSVKRKKTAPTLAQAEQSPLVTPPLVMPPVELRNLEAPPASPMARMAFQSLADAGLPPNVMQSPMKPLNASLWKAEENNVWRIEEDGTLSTSRDGHAWNPIRVDGHTRLHALSVKRTEIWVGGAAGRLFHSIDNGAHWQRMDVQGENGTRVVDAITKIGSSPQHPIEVTTSTGAVWFSIDREHWREQ